jgi:hypothetical protein
MTLGILEAHETTRFKLWEMYSEDHTLEKTIRLLASGPCMQKSRISVYNVSPYLLVHAPKSQIIASWSTCAQNGIFGGKWP